jgi:protoporphyrinogen oxidase
MGRRTAVIIGAGPAGLTAAYELLKKTDIKPLVYEMSEDVGGISRTVEYKGNRIDIGGHRFFSKSDKVMNLWLEILPLQGGPAKDDKALGRVVLYSDAKDAPDPERSDKVMLVRDRISRIFYLRKFFDYPISLTLKTVFSLGVLRTIKIGLSYVEARLFPRKEEKSLEDFFVNRFGKELYVTFFRDYTEKVWGASCNGIKPEWGAQRIKELSVSRAILHALRRMVLKRNGIRQKNIDTSLIERFIYPKLGPGQMWRMVSEIVTQKGGEIHLRHKIVGLSWETDPNQGARVLYAKVMDLETGRIEVVHGDFFFSSMPVKAY